MTVTLISLGNELRRDDGIASEICRSLPDALKTRFEYFDLGIHGEQIATYMKDAEHAIVVDAMLAPDAVGNIAVFATDQLGNTWPSATHGMSWFNELQLAKCTVPVTFVGVAVCDDGWGKGFSPAVKNAQNLLTQRLAKVCTKVLESCNA
jgi:hydrogenase maturation protease